MTALISLLLCSLLSAFAGKLKSLRDMIQFYDNLKCNGEFWSRDSWHYLYDKPLWWQKYVPMANNAWHWVDIVLMLVLLLEVPVVALLPILNNAWWYIPFAILQLWISAIAKTMTYTNEPNTSIWYFKFKLK